MCTITYSTAGHKGGASVRIIMLLVMWGALSQAPSRGVTPSFEVASIKPSPTDGRESLLQPAGTISGKQRNVKDDDRIRLPPSSLRIGWRTFVDCRGQMDNRSPRRRCRCRARNHGTAASVATPGPLRIED